MNYEVGQKVKVYKLWDHDSPAQYGEVLGLTDTGKVLLSNRPDFAKLRLSEFDWFLDWREVKFTPYANIPKLIYQWQGRNN